MTNDRNLASRLVIVAAMFASIVITFFGDMYIIGVTLFLLSSMYAFVYSMQYRERNRLAMGKKLWAAIAVAGVILTLSVISPFIFSNDLRGLGTWAAFTMALAVLLALILSIELLTLSVHVRDKTTPRS